VSNIKRRDTRRDTELDRFASEHLATGRDSEADCYPHLATIASGFLFDFVPVPKQPLPPEFVYITYDPARMRFREDDEISQIEQAIIRWNWIWEAGHIRQDFFAEELPASLAWVCSHRDVNLYLLPDTGLRYEAYAPLLHLLPKRILERFGLPVLRRGLWPSTIHQHLIHRLLTQNFEQKLAQAFAQHVWPLLNSGSPARAFSKDYPIMVLSHNLDYWLPFAYQVIETRLRSWGRVPCDNDEERGRLNKLQAAVPDGISAERPRYGGTLWCGEEEALEATREIVAAAKQVDKLQAIIDAVRSNRVEDDFSKYCSFAREDFERTLYHKRSKVKVSFVQLDDTIPVHGRDSEVLEDLVWQDFLTLLDPKERSVTVCLRNGHTQVSEIGRILGYANHSPVSKALVRIREKAKTYFDLT
jgi:hypothetical protein